MTGSMFTEQFGTSSRTGIYSVLRTARSPDWVIHTPDWPTVAQLISAQGTTG
jgi:hypothetical protein